MEYLTNVHDFCYDVNTKLSLSNLKSLDIKSNLLMTEAIEELIEICNDPDFIAVFDGEENLINRDVIYKNIDNSTKLSIKENKSGGFFIYPVDNKDISIIRFEKLDENKEEYKFIVEIKDRDKFEYETVIKTKEDLNKAIDFVIESFNSHPIFSKYTDDIERLKL